MPDAGFEGLFVADVDIAIPGSEAEEEFARTVNVGSVGTGSGLWVGSSCFGENCWRGSKYTQKADCDRRDTENTEDFFQHAFIIAIKRKKYQCFL